jgi:hypothetical protein
VSRQSRPRRLPLLRNRSAIAQNQQRQPRNVLFLHFSTHHLLRIKAAGFVRRRWNDPHSVRVPQLRRTQCAGAGDAAALGSASAGVKYSIFSLVAM